MSFFVFFFLIAPQFPHSVFDLYLSLPLSLGAATVIPSPVSYSQSDESRDHPEAAGTKLWSNWKHQQLPQPLCAAAHQCQVRFLLLYLCFHIIKVIIFCFQPTTWLLQYYTVLPLIPAHPSSSDVLPSVPALTHGFLLNSVPSSLLGDVWICCSLS